MKKLVKKIFSTVEKNLSGTKFGSSKIVGKGANFVKSKIKDEFVIVDGNKMFLDPQDSLRLSINGIYEEMETILMKKIIKKDENIVDIGANIGYYTLMFAKQVGRNGKVFAFEPEINNFKLLKKNIEINNYQNVICENVAISSTTGKCLLYLDNQNKGSHSMTNDDSSKQTIEINTISLDDYFFNSEISLVKIDIEGHEIEAINGMKNFFEQNQNVKLLLEFSPHLLNYKGIRPESFLKKLIDKGFILHYIDKKNREVNPVRMDDLLKKVNIDKKNHTNLFCSKNNYHFKL